MPPKPVFPDIAATGETTALKPIARDDGRRDATSSSLEVRSAQRARRQPVEVPGRVVVLAPDKFKGSATAAEVAAAVGRGIHAVAPSARLIAVPVADGGDGTVDAALAAGFDSIPVVASGPTGRQVRTSYARRGEVALIELARVCGLTQHPAGLDPLGASSFGLGEALSAAIHDGCRQVILGIGGSASTDGGIGMLQALGVGVFDESGRPVARGGRGMRTVAALDLTTCDPLLHTVEVTVASDVANPLAGPNGAACVYSRQKGASREIVAELDAGLRHWASIVTKTTGIDSSGTPGAGSAGGVGFAALALGARLRSGVELMLELVDFDSALAGADLVITGEGRLDSQTLAGKTPVGVAAAAARAGAPVVAVAGQCALSPAELATLGIRAVYSLTELAEDPSRSMHDAVLLLDKAGIALARRWLTA